MPQSRFKKILVHLFFIGQEKPAQPLRRKSECPLHQHKNPIGKPEQKKQAQIR
jgi:hypothetical protein